MRQNIVIMVKEGKIHIMCASVNRNMLSDAVLDAESDDKKNKVSF